MSNALASNVARSAGNIAGSASAPPSPWPGLEPSREEHGNELNETAYFPGYEDANSFLRAFQDWEGSSPGGWRARHARSPRARRGAPSAVNIEGA